MKHFFNLKVVVENRLFNFILLLNNKLVNFIAGEHGGNMPNGAALIDDLELSSVSEDSE